MGFYYYFLFPTCYICITATDSSSVERTCYEIYVLSLLNPAWKGLCFLYTCQLSRFSPERRSPIGFFNPVILTWNSMQSRNPKGIPPPAHTFNPESRLDFALKSRILSFRQGKSRILKNLFSYQSLFQNFFINFVSFFLRFIFKKENKTRSGFGSLVWAVLDSIKKHKTEQSNWYIFNEYHNWSEINQSNCTIHCRKEATRRPSERQSLFCIILNRRTFWKSTQVQGMGLTIRQWIIK